MYYLPCDNKNILNLTKKENLYAILLIIHKLKC